MAILRKGTNEAQAEAAVEAVERKMVETDDRAAGASESTVVKRTRQKKDFAPIDFGSLVAGTADADTIRTLKPVKGTRTPEQEQTDNLIKQAHAKWVSAGRDLKVNFNVNHAASIVHLRVAKEHREALKYRLQQSATFLQYRIRFGKDHETDILFYVTDRPVKAKSQIEGQTSL